MLILKSLQTTFILIVYGSYTTVLYICCETYLLDVAGSQVALSTDYTTSQSELFDPTLLPNYGCECYIPEEPAEETGFVAILSCSKYTKSHSMICYRKIKPGDYRGLQ